jgi:hypothetical protein
MPAEPVYFSELFNAPTVDAMHKQAVIDYIVRYATGA